MSVTNQPYSCGESCPFRGCSECAYKGWQVDQIDGQTDLIEALEADPEVT